MENILYKIYNLLEGGMQKRDTFSLTAPAV